MNLHVTEEKLKGVVSSFWSESVAKVVSLFLVPVVIGTFLWLNNLGSDVSALTLKMTLMELHVGKIADSVAAIKDDTMLYKGETNGKILQLQTEQINTQENLGDLKDRVDRAIQRIGFGRTGPGSGVGIGGNMQ